MILDLITFSGYIVVDVVFTVGFVMVELEGEQINMNALMFYFFILSAQHADFNMFLYYFRLTNEQRTAVANYFHVYKVPF